MQSDEFSPYLYLNRLVDLWWIVAIAAILGGLLGYIFHGLHPPVYEATATFDVTIDLGRFPIKDIREDMLQYNEDLALNTTKAILLSPVVLNQVVTSLNQQGLSIPVSVLVKNYTIERKHDLWELRYRHENPAIAQKIANLWADIGYQAMLSSQAAEKTPDYVVFQPPSPALLPQAPVVYDRNRLVIAGIILGFTLGILASSLVTRRVKPIPG
jgi:uncharacterized protein involved in exopolysaccharide biosynthesis